MCLDGNKITLTKEDTVLESTQSNDNGMSHSVLKKIEPERNKVAIFLHLYPSGGTFTVVRLMSLHEMTQGCVISGEFVVTAKVMHFRSVLCVLLNVSHHVL